MQVHSDVLISPIFTFKGSTECYSEVHHCAQSRKHLVSAALQLQVSARDLRECVSRHRAGDPSELCGALGREPAAWVGFDGLWVCLLALSDLSLRVSASASTPPPSVMGKEDPEAKEMPSGSTGDEQISASQMYNLHLGICRSIPSPFAFGV